jgi:molybdopterin molybdotransferase
MSQSGKIPSEPAERLIEMSARLAPVADQAVDLSLAAGCVLAQDVRADRDHPACDVSAADGYAIYMRQAVVGEQKIAAISRIGHEPPLMPDVGVVKIVTGAAVPAGAEAIIRREEVEEYPDHILIKVQPTLKLGQDIRRRADNVRGGETILPSGIILGPAQMSALASFGIGRPRIYRPIRVMLIVSGDELLPVDSRPQPWQVRDSHSSAVAAMFSNVNWIEWLGVRSVPDKLPQIVATLSDAMEKCDAVILSGGVSKGDRDFVPAAIKQVGAETIFHGLPIRPGRPMISAIGPRGQAVFGLPGNPLSVLVTARRFASIALRKLAGFAGIDPPMPRVSLVSTDAAHPKLWMYPPTILEPDGRAKIIPARSSGDLVTAAKSDGFVEIPPGESVPERVPFYRWNGL